MKKQSKDFNLAAVIATDGAAAPESTEKHSENLAHEKYDEQKKPVLTKRRPVGRPPKKKQIVHTSLSLSEEMHAYLRRAWRRYETQAGEFVDGPSEFVEELLRAHQARSSR
jgi:hypothetical protein